ncbi:GNAT family N-acetyltransferase [Halalkalibacter urbisdiaboli]|uniref:GNAT family N-acetyltransferase n=1 Tax=Halalkalibacter urbisdiaboli TaxID=1960589 RepID=UPI000B445912|nr:GNAT family N-acetyltransferase [Halalkalibacter urbisdiaboli]
MELKIRGILESELKEFSSILKEAAEWLRNNEMEMWSDNQLSIDTILKNNTVKDLFIGFVNNESAVAVILQEQDSLLWSDETPSLYLHKLAIRRKFAKKGLPQQMVEWAKLQAEKKNKRYLRLDCAADRMKLCNFYEEQGFKKVREEVILGKYPTAFYEFEVIM